MSYTKNAVERLSAGNTQQLDYYHNMMNIAREQNNNMVMAEYKASIIAYLTCMRVNGVISEVEKRALYNWFVR